MTLLGVCPAIGCESASREEDDRPDLLLLTVDTLRPDYLGMYGYDRPTSPYLDTLLADGFHFERTLTTVPRTTPALASLMTGAYPHTTGVRRLLHTLDTEVPTLAQILRRSGYRTVAVVTNQVLKPERGLDRGFEIYDHAGDGRGAAGTTDAALEHLDDADPDRPLFLWVHYIDPHMPYVSDPEIIESFEPEYSGRYAKGFGRRRPKGDPFPDDLPRETAVYRNPLSEEVNAHVRRLYAADIRSTDDQIGRLVARVRERSGDRLLLVFSSDHGESLGEHGYSFEHGEYVYNAASQVPLAFLLPPGHPFARSGSSRVWVSLVDVAPTVLELIGMRGAGNERMEGRSLVPLLAGEELEPRPVFVESAHSHDFENVRGRATNDEAGRFRAAVHGDWKLILAPGHDTPGETWQLYHLATDPGETRNLYREDQSEYLRLRGPLLQWTSLSGESSSGEEAMSSEDRDALEELGYLGE